MQYVHKVKRKGLIKRQRRESMCFARFNMSLAQTLLAARRRRE
jgi:hypothetical protein